MLETAVFARNAMHISRPLRLQYGVDLYPRCRINHFVVDIYYLRWYKVPVASDIRQREVVRQLFLEGPLSRFELHQRTGMTPNGVGSIIETLLKEGLVRECPPEPSNGGRPRVPIDLDPASLNVLGLAISPGHVEACRIGVKGHLIGSPISREVPQPRQLVSVATDLLKRLMN